MEVDASCSASTLPAGNRTEVCHIQGAMASNIRRFPWLPVVDRGCCCSLEACCKVQGYICAVLCLGSFLGIAITWMAFCGRYCDANAVTVGSLALTVGLVGFMTTCMFLVGIYEKRPQFITPYVVYLHFQVFTLIHFAVFVAKPPFLYSSLFFMLPPIVATMHMIVCAHSLRLKMEDAIDRPGSPPQVASAPKLV